MTSPYKKIAIVLFNLGGPDSLEAVQPFLHNLFRDPAIIGLPAIMRLPLACLISSRRAPTARAIYAQMGGKSPILPNTQAQAHALEALLSNNDYNIKTFICMRYWHPMSDEVARQVQNYQPDQIILLPLYPHYSTTTTASSLADWRRASKKIGLSVHSQAVNCYPLQEKLVAAQAQQIRDALRQTQNLKNTRLLFSAHGLPEKIIQKGDPYQWQIEQNTQAIMRLLNTPELDWVNCYQSRVGPLKWIGPSTEDEIHRAGAEGKEVVLMPIAFVSEHSETLVELDIEYKELAHKAGVVNYVRVPTLSADPLFIEALADLCIDALGEKKSPRLCPKDRTQCPCAA